MMYIFRYFVLLLLLLSNRCTTPSETQAESVSKVLNAIYNDSLTLSIDPDLTVSSVYTPISFTVTSTSPWRMNIESPWIITTLNSGGPGETEVSILIQANNTKAIRNSTIIISSNSIDQKINVTQTNTFFEVNTKLLVLNRSTKAKATLLLTGLSKWSAVKTSSWFTLSQTSGDLNGTTSITITPTQANLETNDLIGKIYFQANDQRIEVVVQQIGNILELSTFSISLGSSASIYTPVTLTGNSDWTLNISDSGLSWLRVEDASGRAISSGSLSDSSQIINIVSVSANNTGANRVATVTFHYGNGEKTIAITQNIIAFNINTSSISLPAIESTKTITISGSGENWRISKPNTESWYTVTPSEGVLNGSVSIQIRATANSVVENRVGRLTFISGTLRTTLDITQLAPTLTVSDTVLTVSALNNSSASVLLTGDASWTASTSTSWISLPVTSGVLSGSTPFVITANSANTTNAIRSGTVSISTLDGIQRLITVTQALNSFVLSSNSIVLSSLSARSRSITLSGSSTWVATKPVADDWYSLSSTSGMFTGAYTLQITTTASNNTGSSRTSSVTFTAYTAGAATGVTFTLQVTQPNTTFSITRTLYELSPSLVGEYVSIYLNGTSNWMATKGATDDWYSLSVISGTLEGSLEVRVTLLNVNNSGSNRIGAITFTGAGRQIIATVSQETTTFSTNVSKVYLAKTTNTVRTIVFNGAAVVTISKPVGDTWYSIQTESAVFDGSVLFNITTTNSNTTSQLRTSTITINYGSGSLNLPVEQANVDIDTDRDGLIDITSLTQLNNMRYSLDGRGYRDSANGILYQHDCPNGYAISNIVEGTSSSLAKLSIQGISFTALQNSIGVTTIAATVGSALPPNTVITQGDTNTPTNVYIASEGIYVRSDYNGPIPSYGCYGYELTQHLDLTGTTWNPIGNSNAPFTATFHGNTFELRNLSISSGTTSGFFGTTQDAIIRNVSMINANLSNFTIAGTIIGNQVRGYIFNSSATGTISNSSSAGGLVGTSTGILVSSRSAVNISGSTNMGGLVGILSGGGITGSAGTVTSTGSVSGSNGVGGLVGSMSAGTLHTVSSTGSISGSNNIGGLVGSMSGGTIVTASHTTGSVSGSNNIGGLAGTMSAGSISNSTLTGTFTINSGSSLGGFVGYLTGGTITDASVPGTITISGTASVGGFIGYMAGGTITNAESNAIVVGTSNNIGGFVGISTGGTITTSDSAARVTSNTNGNDIGGFVGSNSASISTSTSTGAITISSSGAGIRSRIGGFAGKNTGTLTTVSSNTGTVTFNNFSVANLSAVSEVGGLVGNNLGSVISSSSSRSLTTPAGSSSIGGLIGYNSGTINNSSSSGTISATSSDTVGGLVGFIDSGSTITSTDTDETFASGAVTGNNYVGGFAGRSYVSLSNVAASGAVTGNNDVGGLIGFIPSGTSDNITLSNLFATGNVTGNDDIGGLVGLVGGTQITLNSTSASGNVISHIYGGGLVGKSYGFIVNSYAKGSVIGENSTGGLIGHQNGSQVLHCFATGNVSNSSKNSSSGAGLIGGVVGYGDSTEIAFVYSRGVVDGGTYGGAVGGVVGQAYGWIKIRYTYATGEQKGSGLYRGSIIGGIPQAVRDHSSTQYCHPLNIYDRDTTKYKDSSGSNGCKDRNGFSTAQMQSASTTDTHSLAKLFGTDIAEGYRRYSFTQGQYPKLYRWGSTDIPKTATLLDGQ